MLAMVRSRRAWVYVLSLAALVVPAGGIAYLGAVSYRNERGRSRHRTSVSARRRRASRAGSRAPSRTRLIRPSARWWRRAAGGAAGALLVLDRCRSAPSGAAFRPPAGDLGGGLERGAGCAGGRLEDCVQELSTRQARIARLHAAERAEAGGRGSRPAASTLRWPRSPIPGRRRCSVWHACLRGSATVAHRVRSPSSSAGSATAASTACRRGWWRIRCAPRRRAGTQRRPRWPRCSGSPTTCSPASTPSHR